MLIEQKLRRARAVLRIADALDAETGQNVIGRGSGCRANSRRVVVDPATVVLFHPNCRMKMGWDTPYQIREVIEPHASCRVMEVLRANTARLQANIHADGKIEIHRFEPGLWEQTFGVTANGDTVALVPDIFFDPLDPTFRAWLARNPRPPIPEFA